MHTVILVLYAHAKGTIHPPLSAREFYRAANEKILDPVAAADHFLGRATVGPDMAAPLVNPRGHPAA